MSWPWLLRSSHHAVRHLDRRGVARRRNIRKMTDGDVNLASDRYRRGRPLRDVVAGFEVDASTLAREFRRAATAIRPRRGGQAQVELNRGD